MIFMKPRPRSSRTTGPSSRTINSCQCRPRATFFFDGATFHVDTLEAAGRQVIGQTPLWSEPLFLFAIDDDGIILEGHKLQGARPILGLDQRLQRDAHVRKLGL